MHPTKTLWAVVAFAYACLFAFGFLDNARGPAFPFILEDLDLTDTQGSWLFSATSITSFFASYSCRWILPVTGSLWALRIGLATMAVGVVGLGLADSLFTLVLAACLMGVGQGTNVVAQHTIIQESSPSHQWRRLFSGLHSTYGFASLLVPLMFGQLIGWDWAWSGIFVLFGLVPAAVLGWSFALPARKVPPVPPVRHQVAGDAVGWQYVWVSVFLAGYLVGELSITTRIVLLLQRDFGFAAETASHYLTGFFFCLFLSRLILFFKPITVLSSRRILQTCLLAGMSFYVLGLLHNPLWLVASGFVMGPCFPVTIEMLAQLFGIRSGHALSLAMSYGTLSVVIMHYGLGVLSDWVGLHSALWLGPTSLVIALLVLSIWVTKKPLSCH